MPDRAAINLITAYLKHICPEQSRQFVYPVHDGIQAHVTAPLFFAAERRFAIAEVVATWMPGDPIKDFCLLVEAELLKNSYNHTAQRKELVQ